MELTIVKQGDSKKEEHSAESMSKDKELADESSLAKRMVKRANPKDLLLLHSKQSKSGESCIQKSFSRRIHGLDTRIPKHIICLDEKYLRRCLQSIYVTASKAGSYNSHDNLCSSKMGVFSDGSIIRTTYASNLADFLTECPLDCRMGNESRTIKNILDSPLFPQSGDMDGDINFGIAKLVDTKKSLGYTSWLSASSEQKLENKMVVLGKNSYGSEPVNNRLVSVSSTIATVPDQNSSVSEGTIQGMLQCTWKAGFPHYVFSVDDQKELYVANLGKAESPYDKVLDYVYFFHSVSGSKKEHEIRVNESDLVGKMKVSTKFSLCPNNSEMVETEFVLFGCEESSLGEVQTSSQYPKKRNTGLSKKMVEAFKLSHSSRERTSSKYVGASGMHENFSGKLFPNTNANPNSCGTSNLLGNHFAPNLELAAIIAKDHIRSGCKGTEIGGWGLNFLKKVETSKAVTSLEASPSACCLRSSGDCSTSMDVLVPAGFHGGPRNRNSGPSSLTERWRSGGLCDCGGWDIGCPLTVLDTRRSIKDVSSPQVDTKGDKKSLDLFIQGSMRGAPVMKMVNIHEGLYFIHFQSSLSALQSFSIAVAIIHTRTPALQPKVYRS
ncbi:uncharacterized protein LOC131322122 [Rhododendron vialii]|uniref:uncharacterized protein LOC131322122 n=1 Tax=Rhododendron vialii TaxID=182163 RepID=UPI0026602BA0|nr:uncharacterized protein LOC131322122 [Rhododendron vialii]XP_058209269.1 uncharacterized protein LOC131322122 [Rhododendron vialii]XP_058209271.1 uncharacterized protein LOC131322122 [Rhododendron vialii]XP_058209272.1 uncharacterized protein LOC131322122 [Rhododendron vialii]XP_058209273.1 uncharacterized protein LOC131322122 [Rhododendron vialii]XP_058209274.1 uncharacterized protein LOC131322122 [Rhododendron vialii]XP_058209275.1 uncharacterized protein LOC131322122 [Rhododendron viali